MILEFTLANWNLKIHLSKLILKTDQLIKTEHTFDLMLTYKDTYGIIYIWRKYMIYQMFQNLHMVVDMCIHCNTTLYGVQSTGKRS